MTTKKCPYCGQSLDSAAFKCTRCNKWVDNEVFNRLCEDDVKLIKNNDLTPFTPTLITAMAIDLLKDNNYLEEAIQKWAGTTLNGEQQFNLLIFNSFCYFKAICSSARMKQGCGYTITEVLKAVLLQGVTQLLKERIEHAPSLDITQEHGKILYTKFQAILDKIPWEASSASQLEASNAFGAVILSDNTPLSLAGFHLYARFWTTIENMEAVFSKIFLVEEDDFDWRTVVGI